MRLSFVVKLVFRLTVVVLAGWFIVRVIDRFITEGWRAGATSLFFALVGAAAVFAISRWLDRLPEPEPKDWSEDE